jgi:hypothetical protein
MQRKKYSHLNCQIRSAPTYYNIRFGSKWREKWSRKFEQFFKWKLWA